MPVVPSIRGRRCAVAAVLALPALVPPARADRIRGDCRQDGATIRFVDGAAYRKAPFPGSDRNDPVVVLAAFALDKVALAAAADKSAEIGRQRRRAGEPGLLELHLHGGRVIAMYREPGARFALVSRDPAGRLRMRADDAEHVALSVELDGGDDSLRCRLDVDLAYAAATPVAAAPEPVGESCRRVHEAGAAAAPVGRSRLPKAADPAAPAREIVRRAGRQPPEETAA